MTTTKNPKSKFSAADLLILATMKSVAKYDKSCELQDSVNHQILEHKWYPGFAPRYLWIRLV